MEQGHVADDGSREGPTWRVARAWIAAFVNRRRRRFRALMRLERRRLERFGDRQRERIARVAAVSRAALRRALNVVRHAAKYAVALVVLSLVLGGSAFAANSLYSGFGAPRQSVSRVAWADRSVRYGTSQCASCHTSHVATLAASPHTKLSCELCHSPTVDHPGGNPTAVAALPASDSATCVACHDNVGGRPAWVPEIDTLSHYATVDCLRCHDPHSTAALAPPEVTHPLDRLPACTTCHSPAGLKRYPEGHQPAADNVCLACHKPTAVPR